MCQKSTFLAKIAYFCHNWQKIPIFDKKSSFFGFLTEFSHFSHFWQDLDINFKNTAYLPLFFDIIKIDFFINFRSQIIGPKNMKKRDFSTKISVFSQKYQFLQPIFKNSLVITSKTCQFFIDFSTKIGPLDHLAKKQSKNGQKWPFLALL